MNDEDLLKIGGLTQDSERFTPHVEKYY